MLLLRAFRLLSAKERRALADFSRNPLVNRRPEVTRLADYLAEQLGKPTSKALDAERLFAAAFPGVAYDNRALRHTMSYLLTVLRQYLTWAEAQADEAEQQRLLLRALRRRGMDKLLEKDWQSAADGIEKQPLRDARHHYRQYQLHQEKAERAARHERSAALDLQPLPDELTNFYLAEMLRHACTALMQQAVAGKVHRFDVLEALLAAVDLREVLRVPAVALYYQAYQMLKLPEAAEPFDRLKALLAEHADCFSAAELRGLYLLAINGCIRRMNAGQRAYIREAFELYRAALSRDVLKENGFISPYTYKNILRSAVALGESVWAEQFLEQYRPVLHARERDNVYRYNLAFLRFQQQDYARAMPLLQQVEFEDPLNNLDARRMLLRTYYELGEKEALTSLLHSFAAYLRRQKGLGYHRATNEKLLYFTKKLLETDQRNASAWIALRAEIEATPEVAERAWLLEQVSTAL